MMTRNSVPSLTRGSHRRHSVLSWSWKAQGREKEEVCSWVHCQPRPLCSELGYCEEG
ncbi:hypothetical protein CsSME_00009995 [Camellia sinensis var. sinensis]